VAKLRDVATLVGTAMVGWTMFPREKRSAGALRIGVVTEPLGKQDSPALRYLILRLNAIQQSFEFQLVPAPPGDSLIARLMSSNEPLLSREEIKSKRLLEFFGVRERGYLERRRAQFRCEEAPPSHIIILSTALLEDRWYSARKPDGAPVVALIALGGWKRTMAPPTEVELFLAMLLRQAAALAIPRLDSSMHFGTKGCMFDFNQELRDVRYKALNGYVCEFCAGVIAGSDRPTLASDLRIALGKEWLGSLDDPASPASIAAKLGHDLFINKGLVPTALEKIESVLPTESLKLLFTIIGAVVGGIVGSWIALKLGLPTHGKSP
jgi:hypothetical protein